ncbi:hypothetical protein [Chthonobacter rhizosphaerae]|uniref:hypothetical protein n=1 Tax=Chthonobacter rhizosphaerae TaxID=2735553 RepID=UPI0015EFC6A2|nr:hypothetical protein [Chthonobacter rhizosphaerae]
MIAQVRTAPVFAYERHLAESMVGVLAELRQVDMDTLAGLIFAQSHANIEDVVVSATELHFRERAVTYAWSSELEVAWGRPPVLHLDLEFQHAGVFLAFRATMGTVDAGVSVMALMVDGRTADGGDDLAHVVRALHAARRPNVRA